MEEYFKYVKSKDIYLIKKKYLKLKFYQTDNEIFNELVNQIGGSANHKLYNKIIKSKDRKVTMIKEGEILIKKMQKIKKLKKEYTKEGFFTYKYYLLISQMTTLLQMLDDPNFNYDKVVVAGGLWAKLYMNFLSKKYKNNITDAKKIAIIKKDSNIK